MAKRTTEQAESLFGMAFRHMDHSPNRNAPEGQYALYTSMGMENLAKALREIYDKLEKIEKKLALKGS